MPTSETIIGLVPSMIAGTLVVLVTVWMGWAIARTSEMMIVRGVTWWVRHVVVRIVHSRSWSFRAGAILVNNASICALVVASGAWPVAPWLAITGLGVSLGMGIRIIGDPVSGISLPLGSASGWRLNLGLALNMLEPPAIILCLGLGLSQRAMGAIVAGSTAWGLFLIGALPALSIAAAGEALWLGSGGHENHSPQPESSDMIPTDPGHSAETD